MKVLKYLVVILFMLGFTMSCATKGVGTNTETKSSKCETAPKPIKYYPPFYPIEAAVRHIDGKAIVRCIVTTEGVPKDIEVADA